MTFFIQLREKYEHLKAEVDKRSDIPSFAESDNLKETELNNNLLAIPTPCGE